MNEVFNSNLEFRATLDIDFAIMINSWNDYKLIFENILNSPGFSRTQLPHRLKYAHIDIDIIPFGDISSDNQIRWFDDDSFILNVLGYREVYENSISCQINNIVFKVTSLEGFIITKLLAWSDRSHITKKDAEDLGIILFNYTDLNPDELFLNFSHLIESPNYDYVLTGVKIIGEKLGIFIDNSTELKNEVNSILQNELSDPDNSLLAAHLNKIETYEYNYTILKTLYDTLF